MTNSNKPDAQAEAADELRKLDAYNTKAIMSAIIFSKIIDDVNHGSYGGLEKMFKDTALNDRRAFAIQAADLLYDRRYSKTD